MKIVITDSFIESLKRLREHERWYYRLYELFRWKIPAYIRNIRKFSKELWKFRAFDSHYSLSMLRRGIELNKEYISKYGNEVEESRSKKVAAMEKTVSILTNVLGANAYVDIAEAALGKTVNTDYLFNDEDEPFSVTQDNKDIFTLSQKLEEEEWERLWTLIKGTRAEEFDGSGIRGWWD